MNMRASEDQLMARFQNGDWDAFSEIVGRYHDFLVRFFRIRGRDQAESEDLAQEVWKKVHRARHEYSARAPFRAYLARIARNHLIDFLRGSEHRHAPMSLDRAMSADSDEGSPGLITALPVAVIDPMEEVMGGELRDRISDALLHLPEPMRETFVLCVLEDVKYEDAAELLGVPVGTIKSRIFNAIRKLRDTLKAEVL